MSMSDSERLRLQRLTAACTSAEGSTKPDQCRGVTGRQEPQSKAMVCGRISMSSISKPGMVSTRLICSSCSRSLRGLSERPLAYSTMCNVRSWHGTPGTSCRVGTGSGTGASCSERQRNARIGQDNSYTDAAHGPGHCTGSGLPTASDASAAVKRALNAPAVAFP